MVRAGALQGRLLYVADREADQNLLADFGTVTQLPDLVRARRSQPLARYSVWQLQAPRPADRRQNALRDKPFLRFFGRERTPEAGCRRGWGRSGSDVRS